MSEVKIKACPFCGKTKARVWNYNHPCVVCEACWSNGPRGPKLEGDMANLAVAGEAATDLWNKRAGDREPAVSKTPSDKHVGISELLGRTASIIQGLGEQNEPATFEGRKGYWVQADCVFIEARDAATAIVKYRHELEVARIGCSHNHFCGSILAGKRREWINAIAKDPSCHDSLKQALQQDAP